ncbi:hypothetical protein PIGHUM_00143 [Pigmentiphaga humi]|uniref:Uncharacterized protein n=1 Tax=Pigmentiphaga humi TaxID=2478468 RepID=A0A3P4AZ30_9BURK|nr:choice-of-anchor tandem repeat GloVer-containing protein [Pigmentiphaga humi]VCU68095.1 hypothetical protein PIGHUM_00143 [Pigmentiphaga humi]
MMLTRLHASLLCAGLLAGANAAGAATVAPAVFTHLFDTPILESGLTSRPMQTPVLIGGVLWGNSYNTGVYRFDPAAATGKYTMAYPAVGFAGTNYQISQGSQRGQLLAVGSVVIGNNERQNKLFRYSATLAPEYIAVTENKGLALAGNLLADAAGNVYVLSRNDGQGATGNGSIWKLSADLTSFAPVYEFASGAAQPQGASPAWFALDDTGNWFYGISSAGGTGDAPAGTIWRVRTDGTGFEVLHTLSAADDGAGTGLLFHDGMLYGVSAKGLFQLSPADKAYTPLHTFGAGVADDGSQPAGRLTLGADHSLYGVTWAGGAANQGTVFRLVLDPVRGSRPVYEQVHSFDLATRNEGIEPWGLIADPAGTTLYGATFRGGERGEIFYDPPEIAGKTQGSLFKLTVAAPAAPTIARFQFNGSGADSLTVVPGAALAVSWQATDAELCSADGANGGLWAGEKDASAGTHDETLSAPATEGRLDFTLTCTGRGGSVSASRTVLVQKPVEPDNGSQGGGGGGGALQAWLLLALGLLALPFRRRARG